MSIKLSDERFEEIKEIVVNMFKKFDIHCVPISGFEIATKMNVKIRPYSAYSKEKKKIFLKKSEDGFSVLTDKGWYIYYNDEKTYGRINNTIMHEIGHIVLDHTEDSELAEKEVKFFAKYALCPPVLVHRLKLRTVIEIRNKFEISYQAARYALNYYKKWIEFGGKNYTNYELQTIELFNI